MTTGWPSTCILSRNQPLQSLCIPLYFTLQSMRHGIMQDLHRALADISAIRGQMARGTVFRGYGPAALAATGGLAVVAAILQAAWIDKPAENFLSYLTL